MNNQSDYRQFFLKAEASIGITKENFNKKFVYSLTDPYDNYLLDRNIPTPSQLQGFTLQQEKNISHLMSEMIFRAAQSLRLPVSTAIVALSVAHYFYSRVGHLDYDFRDVAMGAMFLACKSQETLRKSYEISAVFDQIFKIFQGQKMPIKILILNSQEYEYMRKQVLELQNHILFELGFQIYRLFDIPHRYIGGLFKALQKHPKYKLICQTAWTLLNDFYRTSCCLHYPGQIIAAASIYLTIIKLNIKMPEVAWWILMQANIDSIQELITQLQNFYQNSRSIKYSLQSIAAHINEVGQRQGLTNVFPVNYYRKIMLDINSQYKMRKVVQVEIEVKAQQTAQADKQLPAQSIGEKDQNQSKQSTRKKKKEKKEKKKDKKRKKDKKQKSKKKYDNSSSNRSRSRSRDRRQQSSGSKSIKMKKLAQSRQSPDIKDLNQNRPAIQQNKSKIEKIEEQIIVEPMQRPQKKEGVKQMQLESAKGLLSKVSNQLSQLKKNQIKKPLPKKQQSEEEDEDQQILADLIKKKKLNAEKKGLA